ncbi:MAG: Asp-tRNA(Asn)/Glu-tRNA(Gln) amidotransferase subunit GatC [Candidatus Omnitrophica bacterium]|nr:Asp-tRNA(Asn)/Glu-tRNA(Gln) amidotransferase subunit GatC [Candidatus Omnitrophota bacterium]
MVITKETVSHLADLARINLQDKELEKLVFQLQDILGFIDTLKDEDVSKVNPTTHAVPLANVLRQDLPCASLPLEKTLMNAPQKEGNFFVVPKVIE